VRLLPFFAELTFHVIPAKLDGQLGKVYAWIEELGGRCVSAEEGTLVVTALKGRARLEKLISRDILVRV
jgi:DNA polymerase mu